MRLRRLVLALVALSLAGPAWAETVTRDVRIIVPFAPGGTVDLLGRMLAEALAPRLNGRNAVVENRSGGGTFIAMQAAAAAPDGHTLALSATAILATAPVLPGFTMPMDTDRDLVPVTSLIRVPMVLVGRPDAPYRTLPELIAYGRAHPGKLNIGNSGLGGQTHLLAARLGHEGGFAMEQIQYRGGTPALLDILAGNADLYFSLLPESLPFIRDGRLRPIVFVSTERNPTLPDVPLAREILPGFTGDVGYGLVMAAATPPGWIGFWNAEINRVMNDQAFRRRLEDRQVLPMNGTAAAYREEIAHDRRVWGEVIRAASIRAGS
ncbi:Bug family tripartite tricarboxylate transporter substrate binding protein [Roseococcus sp. YIM B11640]|uniref:Bug family tripartite tricarboxylate transporter substrate binding protein n=1 Tax=Roseococcus sp. YIM B11640 TaxID=3133973 RepID=UPI003C7BE529